ncbi:uncharacterized protein LOC110872821 isoform X2 [Helianthus annuus]|uniref:uncharacterized protein LOC110872821 isoform X2 n=1 Tax=Helianthus annuus TaxID=4232 RepID=UPI001652E257|nr:uncharacterized protein LOC110872821 isoform X2 [Helianthus annuus]
MHFWFSIWTLHCPKVLETAWSTIKQKHHQLQGFVMIQMQKWKYTAAFANKEVVFFVIHTSSKSGLRVQATDEAHAKFRYTSQSYCGITSFMLLNELLDPHKGYLMHDTCIFKDNGIVKETRYVGPQNQGIMIMNSLLQTLYYIPYFKKVMYQVDAR